MTVMASLHATGPRARILVVDDEAPLRRIAEYQLAQAGYEVALAEDGRRGLDLAADFRPDLVITDLRMPGLGGEQLVDELLRRDPGLPVVVVTGHGTVDGAVKAMRRGVADYVLKPVSWDEMLVTVQRLLQGAALARDNDRLRSELVQRTKFEEIAGRSPAMQTLFRQMERLLQSDATVLVFGESGTGKELVGRALHFQGKRSVGPFVPINCGAIPHDLIESQLFGHEKGAFTGADRLHRGCFEQAHGGTLFLDEVGEIPPAQQVKLLRVLTERRITRVGGEQSIPVDVRLVAATNRPLDVAVEEGDFRSDLYYRLAVVPLVLPPLRERGHDVLVLAERFLARSTGRPIAIAPEAADVLLAYAWPGNVRELENVVEQAVVMGNVTSHLHADDLPPSIRRTRAPVPSVPEGFPPEGVNLEQIEREWMTRALTFTGGNRKRAARLLGISRRALLYRIDKHRISVPGRETPASDDQDPTDEIDGEAGAAP